MELSVLLPTIPLVAITIVAWHFLNSLWLRPKKLERFLRDQGFQGNPYRPISGDLPEISHMAQSALSKPLPTLSHDIMSRTGPFGLKQHGIDSFIWNGRTPKINIAKPEMIREIFTKYEIYRKQPVGKPSTFGLVLRDGDDWAKVRRIINPAFHLEKLKNMLPVMEVSCDMMLHQWEDQIATEKGSIEVDVYSSLSTLSGDVILRTSFGSSYDEGKILFQLQSESINLKFQQFRSVRYHIPGWRYFPSKINRRIKELGHATDEAVNKLVVKRERLMSEGGEDATKNDLLGIMLESNRKEIEEHGSGLSKEEIVKECQLFLLAGKDTTSSLLTWTLVLLSQYQEWQTKAREEVLHILGKDNSPDFEGLTRLKIVSMILHETLRFYPPIGGVNRIVAQDTKLKHLSLLHGMEITISSITLHRDPNIWGADANEFNPARFSQGISNAGNVAGSFLPFAWGPRMCIGQNFALYEAKLTLAKILQRYSFKLSPSYVHAPMTIVGLVPQFGAPLIFEKI